MFVYVCKFSICALLVWLLLCCRSLPVSTSLFPVLLPLLQDITSSPSSAERVFVLIKSLPSIPVSGFSLTSIFFQGDRNRRGTYGLNGKTECLREGLSV